jgi:glycosyltransferase involved in cell wall biosynthesis
MNKTHKHIAIVLSFSGQGGVERMMINLMEQLIRSGVQVDLLRMKKKGPYAKAIPAGVRIIDLPSQHALGNIFPVRNYLRRHHVHALLAAKDRACRVALLARILAGVQTRIVLRLGTNLTASLAKEHPLKRWARCLPPRLLYAKANVIIGVSQGVAKDIAQVTKIPEPSIQVIPNPVITHQLLKKAAQPLDHEWFKDNTIPVIVASGRLTRQKDFPTLIRAVARVKEKQNVRLIILGEGKDRSLLENTITKLQLHDSVSLPGFTPNPYPYMQHADVFVLSSIWEGSPNVLTEAMGLGTPVVATDCPSGPREILDNGRLGPLVCAGDHDGLAEAIVDVLHNPLPSCTLKNSVADYAVENSAHLYLQALIPSNTHP